MKIFASIELTLNKNVKKGEEESLSSLFNFRDRVKRMEVLQDMEEGQTVKAVVEGLGETDLALGNFMEKGQKKTIMTLFWLPEKTRLFQMQKDAAAGEKVNITFWKP
jgi:hypothetical protein